MIIWDTTVLFGEVTAEAHLFGVLTRCRALGLTVTKVRRHPSRQSSA